MNDLARAYELRGDMIKELQGDIERLTDENSRLQSIVDIISSLTLDHESDCAVIALAGQATNRWWPECDCDISKLEDALSIAGEGEQT